MKIVLSTVLETKLQPMAGSSVNNWSTPQSYPTITTIINTTIFFNLGTNYLWICTEGYDRIVYMDTVGKSSIHL